MRKISFIGLLIALAPSLCMGESLRVNRLVQEKQRKMAELEKCMGSTKGLKIAGISTLGLTAVGVAGNVVEAKKIKDYDTKIASTDKSIEKTQQEIDDTKTTLATKKAEAEAKKKAEEEKRQRQTNCTQTGGQWHEDMGVCTCNTKAGYKSGEGGLCELDATLLSGQANAGGQNGTVNVNNNGENTTTNANNNVSNSGNSGNANGAVQAVAAAQLPSYYNKCDANVTGYRCDALVTFVDWEGESEERAVKHADTVVAEQACNKLKALYDDNGSCWKTNPTSTSNSNSASTHNSSQQNSGTLLKDAVARDIKELRRETDYQAFNIATIGYRPCEVPSSLKSGLDSAIKDAENRCRNKLPDRVKERKLTTVDSGAGCGATKSETDSVGKTANIVSRCEVVKCNSDYDLKNGACFNKDTQTVEGVVVSGSGANSAAGNSNVANANNANNNANNNASSSTVNSTSENTLKKVVERDVAAINATPGKIGAKIYLSGYSSLRLPYPLDDKILEAYQRFGERCNNSSTDEYKVGRTWTTDKADSEATEPGSTYEEDYIVPSPSTKYLLASCACDEEQGFIEEKGDCVEKNERKRCENSGGDYDQYRCICTGDYEPTNDEFKCRKKIY